MPDLSLTGNSIAAVRKPQCSLAFGNGSGQPLGGEDPWQRSIWSVVTRCAMAPHTDLALILLAGDNQAPAVAVADEGGISLGYEDEGTALVFTAEVEKVYFTIRGTKGIEAVNGSSALSRLRINQSYEQQSAGEIVSDLASQAGVETDSVESGMDLPFYVIDDRRSAWEHMALLAQLCGYVAYFSTENKLCFGVLSAGQAVQTFTYGVDILALEAIQAESPAGAFVVVGEGAAGSQGDEAWSWLIKDPASVTAEAGGGPGRKVITAPSLRCAQAVQSVADCLAAAAQRKVNTGRIVTAGAPAVTVGAAVEIADLPEDALNGTCLVMRVVHVFSKQSGFISRIDFCKPGAGGGGGLP